MAKSNFYKMSMATTKKLAEELRKMGDDTIKAAGGSLYRSGHRIMAQSQEVYVPVDTGALRASGNVSMPEYDTSGNVEVVLGYGNSSVDYAIIVHETNRNYNHGKVWKYLETPLKEGLPEVEKNLVTDINKVLK